MSTRIELESALASAEAEWRRANDSVSKARAERDRVHANWGRVVNDRRKSEGDRRKAGNNAYQAVFDRRSAYSDRRVRDADIAALSKAVADRHEAYLDLSKADETWTRAMAGLNLATAERDRAIAALKAFDWGQTPRYAVHKHVPGHGASFSSAD